MTTRFIRMLTTCLVIFASLFFWTLAPNLFNQSKQFIVLSIGLILGLAFFIKILATKSLSFTKSSLSFSLIFFLLAIAAGIIFTSEGRPEALASKGLLLLSLPLMSLFILMTQKSTSIIKSISFTLMFTSIILALHSLLQLTVLSSVSILPGFMQTKLFTPTGDYLTTLILIILGIGSAIPKLNSDNLKSKSLSLITILLGTISSVAIISLMLPGSILSLTLIPYKETWSITLDALKSLRSLFLGVGIANYSSHFTAVKPLSLNATSLWNTLPQTGTSELLTLFTTTGILGGFALILIFIQSLRESKNTALYFPIIIATIALIFTPASIPLYVIYFVMIASLSHSEPTKLDLTPKTAIVIGIFGISLLITGYAYSLRPIIAEFYISKAQAALKNSDGKGVYDNSLKAIQFYPRMTIYHMSFADTNMSLATALSQKQGLSDEEKTTISTLIQQAVSEGKNAVTLRPNYSSAWLTLAKIYRNLINVASGADTYAIENYARAVALDPANPSLRIEFGGIFYQLGVSAKEQKDKDIYFGRAKSEFQTAIQLRANLPNAYYNLSKLYETTNDYEGAYLAMQKTLSLLGPDNPDLDRATAELATLKTKLPKPTTAPTTPPSTSTESSLAPSDLATPSPLPSPLPSGSLDVDFK